MSGKMRMQGMMGGGLPGLLKEGYQHFSGLEEAILKNVAACKDLADITRTSLGPNGMNKLVINHLEKLFVTSDAATITTELEVAHPAAKMVTMAAKMQESEVGDGTNFVVTLAGELLHQAQELLRMGVHPSEIVSGYNTATKKAMELMEASVCRSVEDVRSVDQLIVPLKAVLAAKLWGHEDLLAPLVAEACVSTMPPSRPSINVDNVRVAKLVGATIGDSQVVKGVVVLRDAHGAVKHVENAKIAVYGGAVEASETETKAAVVLSDADELMNYTKGEEKLMEDTIRGIADAGINVIVSGGAISEIAQHYIDKFNMFSIKVLSKFELRRLCRSIGATACARLGPPMPEEIGTAASVSVQELSSRRVTVFKQVDDGETGGISTIVLRGSTMNILDDIERAIDDGVNTVKVLCRDARLLPGAAAVEMEMALRLREFGDASPGMAQYAINAYATAFEVFARTLSENAGQSATDTISALYAAHAAGRKSAGVDIEDTEGGLLDAEEAGVFDTFAVKKEALRLAADAALTVLRVDQIIMSKQAGGPKPREPGAPDA